MWYLYWFSSLPCNNLTRASFPGKFSIRIVPNQTPEEVEGLVKAYLDKKWAERGSKNACEVSMGHGGRCWVSDVNHPNFVAGRKATEMVYGVQPDLTREGECFKEPVGHQLLDVILFCQVLFSSENKGPV